MRVFLTVLCAGLFVFHAARADEIVGFAGDPHACFVAVKLEQAEDMLHVYPLGRTPSRHCDVTPALTQEALELAFEHMASIQEARPLRLIFLGRLFDYPWLSRGLSAWAGQSGKWDPVNGRAAAVDESDNAVVAELIYFMTAEKLRSHRNLREEDREGLVFLPGLLARYGYEFESASAEKIIVGFDGNLNMPTDIVDPPILPFDALVHLRIAKAP